MNKEWVFITVDGKEYRAKVGSTIIQFFNEIGIAHPQICHVPQLDPIQTCDTCIVEVNGKLVRACSTKLVEGMVIERNSSRAKAAQKEAMDRILENHMLYCTVCDNNNGNCKVHNTVHMMGIESQKYPYTAKVDPSEVDMSNPFYRYDPNQCIACGQCVEVCQSLQVNETLSIDWSLDRPRVLWDKGLAINESSCVSCGQCVTVCPCNALMEKSMLGKAGFMTNIKPNLLQSMISFVKDVEPNYGAILAVSDIESSMREANIKRTKTVCTFCGVGCSYEVWTKGRDILKIQPVSEAPVNGISTCVKGKFGWDFVNSAERITTPLIRKGDTFVEATWEEALEVIATNMNHIKATYGSNAFGFISSSKVTNEENYLMQKLARQVYGTNNVDNCSRYCQSPATDGLFKTVGMGGDAGTIKDIAAAGLVIIVGANPAEAHPVLATRVKRAHKLHEQKLIVADLRKNEMAERADLFVRPKQGTDDVWLAGVTKYIIDQNWHDQAFIAENVNQFTEYCNVLEKYTLDYTEKVTGIPQDTIKEIAKMIYEADGTCILWAMGVTQNTGGSITSAAISNLLLATGNYRRPGAGAYPLRGHNNVQGACDMATLPNWLPGYQAITDATARGKFEKAYGVSLTTEPGLNNIQMFAAASRGELHGLYIMGEDTALVDANANHVQDVLAELDFLVVQEIFLTKTAHYADVILPAAPSLEKDGTFTNTERRIQRLYQALPPLGESKPDWWIIQKIACALGANWNYKHPSEIMDEIAALAPLYSQATYDRLAGWNSLCWGSYDGADTPLLYQDGFNFPDKKARFSLDEWIPPLQATDEYDLLVNNGRVLEQFHEGNMTNQSAGIASKAPDVFVEVSKELAKERNITDGTFVQLSSPYGHVKLRALVTDRVIGKELYIPMNARGNEEAINILTGPTVDIFTCTPAYKQTYVKMKVLPEKGQSPLPQTNPKGKQRYPQNGVEVTRKWQRPQYTSLVDKD